MKIKDGFSLIKRDGQNIITSNNKSFNTSIMLNETSSFLWQQLENGVSSKEKLLNLLLENYDISTVLALNEINVFLKILNQNGITENEE